MIVDWARDIKRAIVVGAYDASEWNNLDWLYIEPLLRTYEVLKKKFPQTLNYAIMDRDGEGELLVASNGMSSSLLNPKEHLKDYSGITFEKRIKVKIRSLDSLFENGEITGIYDGLIIDTQGAEGFVIRGFEKNIGMINTIIAEVNFKEMYEGNMLEPDFTKYLENLGFQKVGQNIMGEGWGDALYKRK